MGLRVTSVGPIATAAVAWRFEGQTRITAIAKLTLQLVPGGRMRVIEPEPVQRRDRVRKGATLGSLEQHDDGALHQAFVDVTMDASAQLAAGTRRVETRLAVGTEQLTLINKTLSVGVPKAGARAVPIRFEKAWGGLGHRDNPVGVGFSSMSPGQPSIGYPDGSKRTGCFLPIPAAFPARRSLLGSLPAAALQAPLVELPDDFDWEYFQSAPTDQRMPSPTAELWARLWVLAENVHPDHPRLACQLPTATVGARAWIPHGEPIDFALTPAHLHLRPGQMRAVLVYRANVALPARLAPEAVIVMGACSLHGPIHWPEVPPQPKQAAPTPPPSLRGATHPFESTVTMTDVPTPPATPFPLNTEAPQPPASQSQMPGAPWSDRRSPRRVTPAHPFESTVAIDSAPSDDNTLAAAAAKEKHQAEEERLAAERHEQLAAEAHKQRVAEQEVAERKQAVKAAEKRREEEAERFRQAQQQARLREQQRRREEEATRDQNVSELRQGLYAGLGRKRRR